MAYEANYCPQCGTPLVDREAYGRIRRVCPSCGLVFFRDLKVAVGALVRQDNQVLLVRRAVHPEKGKWALPAGYMEYDEEPRSAAQREIREETGLDVTIGPVLDVFPLHNPYVRGVIIVYDARPMGSPPDRLTADDDVDIARWFQVEEIPWDALAFESTRAILERWRKGEI